ncbi:MAG: hypothetical protein J6R29_06885 [Clostridia bacterium]|nr:hypothetical protein [Clostridia bacterium]
MLGLLFIFIIYAVVTILCFLTKYLISLLKKNKKSGNATTQKIYYVENSTPKKRKVKTANPKIAIKGTIVEKDYFEN